ncbi:helix-turn-helix domain-containing protein [Kitasatospora sp. NPDC048540]|uniref:ArsR/SmtB family transcription factor n=1 Tax=unclassified Kitasatospora TaxID=2633591 RepID=UPI000A66206C|nr:helix-turn-helix domain-containing protein [Kitasatospora sp. MBT63]
MSDQVKEREVKDVQTLKALADPVRLAILNALYKRDPGALSVKEIATELGDTPTKLYRHIKQLEQADLIMVAETRLVSGIVESRYRTAQRSLRLSPEVFASGSSERPEALAALLAAMDMIRSDFQNKYLSQELEPIFAPDGTPRYSKFSHFGMRIRPERLVRLRNQLGGILDELAQEGDCTDEDAVDVTLFTLLYAARPLGSSTPTSRTT